MSSDPRDAALRFREDLQRSLTQPFSWLSLAGLFWLQEGANRCGTDSDLDIVLPADSGPAFLGEFIREDGRVHAHLAEGQQGTVDGETVTETEMHTDHSDTPTRLIVGDLQFLVIERGGQLAMRVWWSQHPNRLDFPGRQWYAYDPRYRLPARVERFDPPREVLIDDMLGNQNTGQMDVRLHMQLDDVAFSLDAYQIPDGRYYLVFKDATAGHGTYPAARFLYTEQPDGDQVFVDFNTAYSPPCAFTDFATCPLPIPENVLTFPVPAGEQYTSEH